MKIKIISDGTRYTVVDENNIPLKGVTHIMFHAAVDEPTRVTIEFVGIPVEITSTLKNENQNV